MEFLFNSKGKHIANFLNNQLHSGKGKNIGHFINELGIFVDMHGRYLGEIVHNNRLMYNSSSSHRNTKFGIFGNYGTIGNYGKPGNCGSIGTLVGYKDIETPWLD